MPNNLRTPITRNDKFYSEEDFEYETDCYRIKIKDSKIAAELLKQHSEIEDFEFIKGNMDDVFLNVTGKRLGD